MVLLSPQTGSIVTGPGGADVTETAISTNIIIVVNSVPVGAIQSMTVNEQRTLQMIDEVGTDGHIDSVPIKSTNISGECKRIRYNGMRIAPAFSRDFLHVAAQRIPFDIQILDKWMGDGPSTIITTIRNVWIEKISYGYMADNWVIADDMTWQAEQISSTLNGGQAGTSGVRGFPLQLDSVEMAADVGSLLGSLSAPGLINQFFTGNNIAD
jgi:hypothetical protein